MYFFELPTKAYKYPLITLMLASFLSLSWAQDLDDLDLPRQENLLLWLQPLPNPSIY